MCGEDAHEPTSCAETRLWKRITQATMPELVKRMEQDAKKSGMTANLEWLKNNTKPCPKCHMAIMKNKGCMHMRCRKNFGGCGRSACSLD